MELLGARRPKSLSGIMGIPNIEITLPLMSAHRYVAAISHENSFNIPTWAPSGVLIRMILFAGAFHARPDLMGRVKDSTRVLGPCWIAWYKSLSTDSGDPAFARYAGTGGFNGFRSRRRSSPDFSAAIFKFLPYNQPFRFFSFRIFSRLGPTI